MDKNKPSDQKAQSEDPFELAEKALHQSKIEQEKTGEFRKEKIYKHSD